MRQHEHEEERVHTLWTAQTMTLQQAWKECIMVAAPVLRLSWKLMK